MLDTAAEPKLKLTKRKAIIGGSVMAVAILGAIVIKKSHHETPASATTQDPHASASTAVAAENMPPPPAPLPAPGATIPSIDSTPTFGATPTQGGSLAVAEEETEAGNRGSHHKHAKVTPFGNGPVHHGNVLHLKMDGAIESIEGAQQPTGFAVKIPGRKSLEAAGPLAARDSRIAAIKVSNDGAGAELTVAFKDGVPNYQVSGKGDTLVISLAAGRLDRPHGRQERRRRARMRPSTRSTSTRRPTRTDQRARLA